jgi:hypothetical protein
VKYHTNALLPLAGKEAVGMLAVVTEDKVAFAEGAAAHALQGIDTAGIAFDNGKQLLIIRAGSSESIHGSDSQTETYRQTGAGVAVKPYDISIFQAVSFSGDRNVQTAGRQ